MTEHGEVRAHVKVICDDCSREHEIVIDIEDKTVQVMAFCQQCKTNFAGWQWKMPLSYKEHLVAQNRRVEVHIDKNLPATYQEYESTGLVTSLDVASLIW